MTHDAESFISGWGGLHVPGVERKSEDLAAITHSTVLTRGLGRSYGDASLPPPDKREVASSLLADRILDFNAETGILHAEAGLSLKEINRIFWPQGFSIPVSPGTQYVTLGGMVASDVHGKNHHRDGTIGSHLISLTLRLANDNMVRCSATEERELFFATIGGMGLTGHILDVELKLKAIPSPWIYSESERISDLDHFLLMLKEMGQRWPFTVGWIDCLARGENMGRGILIAGRWAEKGEAPAKLPKPKKPISVPFYFPEFIMSRFTIRLFNSLFFWKHVRRKKQGIVHPESFFYPLDAILNWNRLYGRSGMTQFQCVLPNGQGGESIRRLLDVLFRHGGASFLSVIKDCGQEGPGILSFPMPGMSIALDIPIRNNTQVLINALNEQVIAEGGRIYLTKDALTRPEHFRKMEPRLESWLATRRLWDPELRLRSALSVRLFGDPPERVRPDTLNY